MDIGLVKKTQKNALDDQETIVGGKGRLGLGWLNTTGRIFWDGRASHARLAIAYLGLDQPSPIQN
jgi:hypothetical protein